MAIWEGFQRLRRHHTSGRYDGASLAGVLGHNHDFVGPPEVAPTVRVRPMVASCPALLPQSGLTITTCKPTAITLRKRPSFWLRPTLPNICSGCP